MTDREMIRHDDPKRREKDMKIPSDAEERIRSLHHGEEYEIELSEGSGAEIQKVNDVYVLFSIPLYGGNPVYEDTYTKHRVKALIETINKWS